MGIFGDLNPSGFDGIARDEGELDEYLRLLILHEAITPFFQPIVDLMTGTLFGYEVVTRGRAPLELPDDLFPRARRLGLGPEFDLLCLKLALRKLRNLPADQVSRSRFFINISADFFADPTLMRELSAANLKAHGLEPSMVILELNEREAFDDLPLLDNAVREYSRQGLSVSLDDFGFGTTSIPQLLAARPQFVKIDRELIRNIHMDHYRQHLLKSLVGFCSSVESRIVVEGVEYWEELDVLMRLGVRFVQGYLFGMPESEPLLPSVNIMASMQDRVRKFQYMRAHSEESIASLVIRSHSVPRESVTCAELSEVFQENPHLDHVVIIGKGRPIGMLTRQHFHAQTTGPYGFPLYQTQRIDQFAKTDLLVIRESMPIDVLAKLAMDRVHENLYDPALVVDDEEQYVGTITMKALISRAFDLEVKRALDTNPLTNLPGNRAIERWMSEAMARPQFSVVYADLDKFKEYNDSYGFLAGDEMIRLTGRVLAQLVQHGRPDIRLGHVGGDDFILVGHEPITEELLAELCSTFDQVKQDLFEAEHRAEGHYWAVNRSGEKVKIPLVTMSLAAINGANDPALVPHVAMLSQRAAHLKKKAKVFSAEAGRSCYFLDRRAFPSREEVLAFSRRHEAASIIPPTPTPTESERDPKFLEMLDWPQSSAR